MNYQERIFSLFERVQKLIQEREELIVKLEASNRLIESLQSQGRRSSFVDEMNDDLKQVKQVLDKMMEKRSYE